MNHESSEENNNSNYTGPQIKKLPQQLIDKIAAGEVVQRPSSAVKELIENCLDAGSTEISIGLLQGGLKQLLIEDNGNGIHRDDFPLLCERFATSKIKEFNDLSSLVSFGFRGEALASISFVSTLKITSKQIDSELGYYATFKNGVLFNNTEPEPVNCSQGTIVDVQDLFYNYDVRRKSLNGGEEKKRILKLIGQFATHHATLKFKLKSDNQLQFSTHSILGNTTIQRRERIMQQITRLGDKSFTSSEYESEEYKVKFQGTFSNIGSTKKFKDITLFINNRLVECDSIKKSVEKAYQSCYQSIHDDEGGYFCYISLDMKPQNLDPNVHPTKKEVKFLFEYEISKEMEKWIFNTLQTTPVIKQFSTNLLQRVSSNDTSNNNNTQFNSYGNGSSVKRNSSSSSQSQQQLGMNNQNQSQQKWQDPTKQIRVDPRDQKITRFFSQTQEDNQINLNKSKSQLDISLQNDRINEDDEENHNDNDDDGNVEDVLKKKQMLNENNNIDDSNDDNQREQNINNNNRYSNNRNQNNNNDLQHPRIQLQQQLLTLRNNDYDEKTTFFFKNLSYLGCISSNHFLAQFKDDLYLINSIPICQEVFKYEIIRNFGQIKSELLDQPINLKDILEFFLINFDDIPQDKKNLHLANIDSYVEQYGLLSDFLKDSVGIIIKDNKLIGFPNIFNLFTNDQNFKDISYTLLRIITKVNFDNLLQSGLQLANELSFYFGWKLEKSIQQQKQKQEQQIKQQLEDGEKKRWDDFFEQTMLSLLKTKITLPSLNITEFTVKLFKQEDAYKIFERC